MTCAGEIVIWIIKELSFFSGKGYNRRGREIVGSDRLCGDKNDTQEISYLGKINGRLSKKVEKENC